MASTSAGSPEPVPVVDYTSTVQRPQWSDLPAGAQELVSRAAGSRVRSAAPSATSGFTGGFAAPVVLADGRRVFAKAGSSVNPHVEQAYAREAQVLQALPDGVPAPELVGFAAAAAGEVDQHGWSVVVTGYIEGTIPQPWTERAVAAVHDACLRTASALAPPPADLHLPCLVDVHLGDATVRGCYQDLLHGRLPPPAAQPAWLLRRAEALDGLLAAADGHLAGAIGVHGDLRADNVLIGPDGAAVLLDWNWLMTGPAWVDFVGLLPLARADGLDAEAWVRRSPVTRDVDPEAIDCWLAVVAAYMLSHADQPLWPNGPPAVRVHQRHYARTFLDWLASRRGWN